MTNQMYKHLTSGRSLQIPYQTYWTGVYTVADNWGITMSRALTRLKAVMVSCRNLATDKEANFFRYPGANFTFQLNIGSRKYPEQALDSTPLFWQALQSAIGSHASVLHNPAIDLLSYLTSEYIIGINLEKIMSSNTGTNWSGESTKAGELLHIRTTGSENVDQVYVTLIHDAILVISDQQVEVFS